MVSNPDVFVVQNAKYLASAGKKTQWGQWKQILRFGMFKSDFKCMLELPESWFSVTTPLQLDRAKETEQRLEMTTNKLCLGVF